MQQKRLILSLRRSASKGRMQVRKVTRSIIVIISAIAATSSVAVADVGQAREEESVYVGATRKNDYGTRDCLTPGFYAPDSSTPGIGCVHFEIEEGERFVSVSIDDQLSDVTAGLVWQYDVEGNQLGLKPARYFCDSTRRPLRLYSITTGIIVAALEEDCQDGTSSGATQGTINVVFSKTPR